MIIHSIVCYSTYPITETQEREYKTVVAQFLKPEPAGEMRDILTRLNPTGIYEIETYDLDKDMERLQAIKDGSGFYKIHMDAGRIIDITTDCNYTSDDWDLYDAFSRVFVACVFARHEEEAIEKAYRRWNKLIQNHPLLEMALKPIKYATTAG